MCVPCMHASVRVAACEKGGRGVQGFQDADHLCQQLNLAVVPDSLVAAALCNAGTRVCVCSSCMAARDSCAPPPFCKPVADSPPEPCLVSMTPPPQNNMSCHPQMSPPLPGGHVVCVLHVRQCNTCTHMCVIPSARAAMCVLHAVPPTSSRRSCRRCLGLWCMQTFPRLGQGCWTQSWATSQAT
jgi:hypothetical protein